MIRVIAGKNAQGKTLYLKNEYLSHRDKMQLSNFTAFQNVDQYEIDMDSVERINDAMSLFTMDVKDNHIVFGESQIDSPELVYLANIIVRKVDTIYLDEPEAGLIIPLVSVFAEMLHCVEEKSNITIVTHSGTLCLEFYDNLFCLCNGGLKKIEYEDTDCF